jgi:hypothetical protein
LPWSSEFQKIRRRNPCSPLPVHVLAFPSIKRTQSKRPDPYVSSNSALDSESDGSQPIKLSNNPAAVASKRLRMRKRTHDDEHLPLLQAGNVHLDQHTAGASNTAGASDTVGTSNIASANNIASASDIVGASDAAGTNAFPTTIALQGANTTPSTCASAGTNFGLGANGSVGTIQPIVATYSVTPRDNLRMLDIRSNLGVFGTAPVLPASETALCGSKTVAM